MAIKINPFESTQSFETNMVANTCLSVHFQWNDTMKEKNSVENMPTKEMVPFQANSLGGNGFAI